MLSEELRQRIEELNRQPLPTRRAGPQTVPPPHFSTTDGPLELLLPGSECENASGRHYRIRQPVELFWPGASAAMAPESRDAQVCAPTDVHPEMAAFLEHFPRATLFLDLETCGFAGSMVFLVGLVWHDGDSWLIDQLLARNYAEERAMLETLWQIVEANRVLVTFNGKSFDWPMVLDRSTLHRFAPATSTAQLAHCDLLHHARRRWKRLLPDCKLQTLERAVCRRVRHEDISGADIPVAYHQFVRSGNARELRSILHHNAMDLATLVEVTVKLARQISKEPGGKV